MEINEYSFTAHVLNNFKIAVVSDIHNYDNKEIIDEILKINPTIILLPGDFIHSPSTQQNGIAFLKMATNIATTYCSLGNHENVYSGNLAEDIKATGAILLDNEFALANGLVIGGLSTGFSRGNKYSKLKVSPKPNLDWLVDFEEQEGFKILLCHHPEYYKYLYNRNINLILSGHAHGGQWRIGNIGVYAPGQGIFPKYTSGLYDGKLLVSRGIGNPHLIPRINNKNEIIVLDMK